MSINKIPEKWCINGSELLKNWQNTDMDNMCSCYLDRVNYFYYPKDDKLINWEMKGSKPEGYTVISFKEFSEYVLGNLITGYRMKGEYKRYANAAISIDGGIGFGTAIGSDQVIPSDRVDTIKRLKDAGVLDLWFEPIYKDSLELPVINGYKGEKINDQTVKYGCAEFHVKSLKNLVDFPCSNRKISSIILDSNVQITIEQIKEILLYFKMQD